jgi:hypothetical protein
MLYFLLILLKAEYILILPWTAGIRVPTKQIREFSALNVSSALRLRHCSKWHGDVFNIFNKTLSHFRTFSQYGEVSTLLFFSLILFYSVSF